MNYLTVNYILDQQATSEAKGFLKDLWYAIVEGQFSISSDYNIYKQQFMHIQASSPNEWKFGWNGLYFTLTKDIKNHASFTIVLKPNGHFNYYFS